MQLTPQPYLVTTEEPHNGPQLLPRLSSQRRLRLMEARDLRRNQPRPCSEACATTARKLSTPCLVLYPLPCTLQAALALAAGGSGERNLFQEPNGLCDYPWSRSTRHGCWHPTWAMLQATTRQAWPGRIAPKAGNETRGGIPSARSARPTVRPAPTCRPPLGTCVTSQFHERRPRPKPMGTKRKRHNESGATPT